MPYNSAPCSSSPLTRCSGPVADTTEVPLVMHVRSKRARCVNLVSFLELRFTAKFQHALRRCLAVGPQDFTNLFLQGSIPSMALAGVPKPWHRNVFMLVSLSGSLRASIRFSQGPSTHALELARTWALNVRSVIANLPKSFTDDFSNLLQGLWLIAFDAGVHAITGIPKEIATQARLTSPFGPGGRNSFDCNNVISFDQAFPAPRPCLPCVTAGAVCFITGAVSECAFCLATRMSLSQDAPRSPCPYALVGIFSPFFDASYVFAT